MRAPVGTHCGYTGGRSGPIPVALPQFCIAADAVGSVGRSYVAQVDAALDRVVDLLQFAVEHLVVDVVIVVLAIDVRLAPAGSAHCDGRKRRPIHQLFRRSENGHSGRYNGQFAFGFLNGRLDFVLI